MEGEIINVDGVLLKIMMVENRHGKIMIVEDNDYIESEPADILTMVDILAFPESYNNICIDYCELD